MPSPPKKMTVSQALKFKFTDGKEHKFFDGNGLFLFVAKTGSKIWRQQYRVDGKQKTHVIGGVNLGIDLDEARVRSRAVRLRLHDGLPAAEEKKKAITLAQAATDYWAPLPDERSNGKVTPNKSNNYRHNAITCITTYLIPTMGKRDIRSITKAELLTALKSVDDQGKGVTVRRLRMWVAQVWDWAVEHGYADTNPAAEIKPWVAFKRLPKVNSFAGLDEKEAPQFYRDLAAQPESTARLATMLLCYTWLRTGEMRYLKWSEIEVDGPDGPVWKVPADRMKMGEEHWVPLVPQAMDIILKLKARMRSNCDYMIAQPRKNIPLSENGVLSVIGDIGYGPQGKDIPARMTGHGFRSMGKSWAKDRVSKRGYDKDAIETALAHSKGDKTQRAYDRAKLIDERRRIMTDYANWVESQFQPSLGSNVSTIRPAASA